jgi:septal ring factor EnvC (AmiA/AmiB activator)
MKWIRSAWEWIVAALGILLAYLTLRPQDATEAPEKPEGLEEREEEAKAKQQEAEEAKAEAERDLKRLEAEEDSLTEALNRTPQHRDKNKEDLRRWLRDEYQ